MTTHRLARLGSLSALALGGAMLCSTLPVRAHPHVFVGTKSVFVFEDGQLTALRYTWIFDEMYTATATEGLDTNKDGQFDASELAELLKVNVEGLKEFQYFTEAQLLGKTVTFGDAKDARLEVIELDEAPGPQLIAGPTAAAEPAPAARPGVWTRFSGWVSGLFSRAPKGPQSASGPQQAQQPIPAPADKQKVLTLHMTLPLPAPVPAAQLTVASMGFHYLLGDSQLFIAFEPMGKDPVLLSPGAPAGCRIGTIEPEMDEQQKKLQEAFGRMGSQVMGSPPKAVQVVCSTP